MALQWQSSATPQKVLSRRLIVKCYVRILIQLLLSLYSTDTESRDETQNQQKSNCEEVSAGC